MVDGGGVIIELGVAQAAQFIMGGGGTRVGFQRLFKLLRGGFEFLAVDQVPAALEVGVPFLVLMIVVSRETTAQSGRDQYENGAVKNRPQTFHGTKNKRFPRQRSKTWFGKNSWPIHAGSANSYLLELGLALDRKY